MLTKGIIQSIDYTDNICVVRIPVFETAGTKEQMTAVGIFATTPGAYGGYKVNDVVIVGFENEQYGSPIILGKLFLGNLEESKLDGCALNCTNIKVSTSASIPVSTEIIYDQPGIKNAEVQLSSYGTLKDIVSAVALTSSKLNAINSGNNCTANEQLIGSWVDNSLLYQQTIYFKKGETAINIADITFNTIWIDYGQSFYIDSINGTMTVSNPALTSIDLKNKKINLPTLTSDSGYGYITIKYTKK